MSFLKLKNIANWLTIISLPILYILIKGFIQSIGELPTNSHSGDPNIGAGLLVFAIFLNIPSLSIWIYMSIVKRNKNINN